MYNFDEYINFIKRHFNKDVHEIKLSTHDFKIIELRNNIIENKEYRGKGIGTEGINYLLNFLKKTKYIKLQGEISTVDNVKRLNKFYEKNGFHVD